MSSEAMISLIALMVMMIPVTAILAGAYRSRLAFRQRELELKVELARLELETVRAAPDPLESRVRVLERIATDRARDLASQIDDLARPDPLLN